MECFEPMHRPRHHSSSAKTLTPVTGEQRSSIGRHMGYPEALYTGRCRRVPPGRIHQSAPEDDTQTERRHFDCTLKVKVVRQYSQRFNRPSREPSASRIKSDSFSTKPPSVRPLRRSTRLSTSPVSPPADTTAKDAGTRPEPPPVTQSTSSEGSSNGTFTTLSYGIKKNKKPRKFGCKMCDTFCNSINKLRKHHQQSHILYCSKAFNNPA